jgi:hypothetical protein
MTESAAESATRIKPETSFASCSTPLWSAPASTFNQASTAREAIRKLETAGVSVGAEGTILEHGPRLCRGQPYRRAVRRLARRQGLARHGRRVVQTQQGRGRHACSPAPASRSRCFSSWCSPTTSAASTATKLRIWPWIFHPRSVRHRHRAGSRELGVTLAKCMAYAVNLTVMHGVSHLPVRACSDWLSTDVAAASVYLLTPTAVGR